MPYQRVVNSLKETLLRLFLLGLVVGGGWLLLQFYSEEEIAAGGQRFWAWWSTRFTGELARYWNPAGAAITLGIAALFVLNPLARLLGLRRRRGGGGGSYGDFDGGDSGGDGGGD
jgi:hypothetical protein